MIAHVRARDKAIITDCDVHLHEGAAMGIPLLVCTKAPQLATVLCICAKALQRGLYCAFARTRADDCDVHSHGRIQVVFALMSAPHEACM